MTPQSSSLMVTWDAVSWAWSPKNSHWIKHNSWSNQDGGVEGHVLISSCNSTKITTTYWTAINRRTLEPTKLKDIPHPKTKEKPQQDGERGAIMIKSNPIPAVWATHKLENSNTKEVLSLLWRLWVLHQVSQLGGLAQGLGTPRESDFESQWGLITGLPED